MTTFKSFTPDEIDEANDKLRYAIKILHGDGISQPFRGAVADVLRTKHELEDGGFWWQAKRLDIWLLKAQKARGFL